MITVAAALVAVAAALRIVSISSGVTETLFEIGAGRDVVAVDSYSRRPAAVNKLPRLGGVYDVNPERVLAARPTLVAYQQLDTPAIQSIQAAGVRVMEVPGQSLADDWTAMRMLGAATGHEAAARRLIARVREHLRRSAARVSAQRPLKVLFLLWPDPIWTVGRGSFVDDLLARANLINVLRESPRAWPMVSPEAVAETEPDVVIVDDNEHFTLPAGDAPWRLLAAVRDGRVVHIHEPLQDGPYVGDLLDDIIRATAPYRKRR